MQKPWPKQRSLFERASMRGTPKRSLEMVMGASRPVTEIEPRVFGSGWRKSRCHSPNDAAPAVFGGGGGKSRAHSPNDPPPADARAATPVRLRARPATRRFSQTHESP